MKKSKIPLRDQIYSLMQRIPFGGVRVIKYMQHNKPIVLYEQPYDHAFITIAASQISLLIYVDQKKIIFPFGNTEDQIEAFKVLEDNNIMPSDKEWVDSLVNHTPMIKAMDTFFRSLSNDKMIEIDPPKQTKIDDEINFFDRIILRPNRVILFMFNTDIQETLSFQHPHEFFPIAKVIEDHNLFMPYQLFH